MSGDKAIGSLRWWIWALALAGLGAALLALLWGKPATRPAASGTRIVSLSPALTETLFAIGAGAQVAGVSDYCDYPREATTRVKVGTSLTPRYEAIVNLAPSVIVTEAVVNARPQDLQRLAPTVEIPWLSLTEVVAGTRKLGVVAEQKAAANALADRLWQRLSVEPPPGAPRVLLVLGYGSSKLDEVWFVRRNSIHGAALRAAGGRNAVERDIDGQPRLSLERVVALDPDIILVLTNGEDPASTDAVIANWARITPLSAVKHERVAALVAPEAFANGPRILKLADRLQARLEALWSP